MLRKAQEYLQDLSLALPGKKIYLHVIHNNPFISQLSSNYMREYLPLLAASALISSECQAQDSLLARQTSLVTTNVLEAKTQPYYHQGDEKSGEKKILENLPAYGENPRTWIFSPADALWIDATKKLPLMGENEMLNITWETNRLKEMAQGTDALVLYRSRNPEKLARSQPHDTNFYTFRAFPHEDEFEGSIVSIAALKKVNSKIVVSHKIVSEFGVLEYKVTQAGQDKIATSVYTLQDPEQVDILKLNRNGVLRNTAEISRARRSVIFTYDNEKNKLSNMPPYQVIQKFCNTLNLDNSDFITFTFTPATNYISPVSSK